MLEKIKAIAEEIGRVSPRTLAELDEIRRRLGERRDAHAALEQLEAEAAALAAYAYLPAGAEADLRETIAQHEAAQRNLEAREARRQEEQARRRGELETTLAGLRAYEACGVEDADRLVALAADLRRLAGEEEQARAALAGLHDALDARGYEPTRVETLGRRFGALDEERQRLLGGQAALALEFQTRTAELEQARAGNTEVLRQIDLVRASRRLPGWFLVALGAAGTIAGVVLLGMGGERAIGASLLAAGLLLGLPGTALVLAGAHLRRAARAVHTRAARSTAVVAQQAVDDTAVDARRGVALVLRHGAPVYVGQPDRLAIFVEQTIARYSAFYPLLEALYWRVETGPLTEDLVEAGA